MSAQSLPSFVAVMFYVARHLFPGFGGPFANIGIVSLGYILLGAFVTRLWEITPKGQLPQVMLPPLFKAS